TALRGALGVGRAERARPGTGLGEVAHACRSATDGAGGLELVGRAIVVEAVAALRHIAHPRRRTALRRALRVGRAEGAGSGTALRHVAHARRSSADGAGRLELIRGARVADAITRLRHVAHSGGGAALEAVGLFRVGRTTRARAGTRLRR